MPDYFDTGFCVREPSWHGKENLLAEHPETWDEARMAAGLMWEPKTVEMFKLGSAPEQLVDGERYVYDEHGAVAGTLVAVPDHRLVVRDDNEHQLGVVSDGYTLVSHAAMGEIVEAILSETNVKFDTAGSCRDGAQVWVVAYLDEPEEIAGDDSLTLPYLALLNSHDGSGAAKLVNTSVRVVCANTYGAASMEGDRTGRQFTFRHTAGVMDRINEAKLALAGCRDEHARWRELAEELGKLPISPGALIAFTHEFIAEPVADVISERVRRNIADARATFTKLYEASPTTDAHRGTALGIVDAAVEYLDHVRGFRNVDTYLGRQLLKPEPLKGRAVKLAREIAVEFAMS